MPAVTPAIPPISHLVIVIMTPAEALFAASRATAAVTNAAAAIKTTTTTKVGILTMIQSQKMTRFTMTT